MTSWREESYAVVDLETTGLDAREHEVLSIGIVDVVDGRVRVSSAWYRELRPSTAPSAETVVIHGIRPADAAHAADPGVVADEVIERLRGRRIVAHVAWVESSFLASWLGPRGWKPERPLIDTDTLCRLYLRRSRGLTIDGHVGLGAAAGIFGLPEHRRHHALGDALTTAQLFLALAAAWPYVVGRAEPTAADLANAERLLRGNRLRRLLSR